MVSHNVTVHRLLCGEPEPGPQATVRCRSLLQGGVKSAICPPPRTYPITSLGEIPKQSLLSSLDLARPNLPPSLLLRFLLEGELRSTPKKEKCR